MSDIVERLRARKQFQHQYIECCEEAAAEIERLRAELKIKSEFISARQCPDHSGKWERGRCLQCELEAAEAQVEALTAELEAARRDAERYRWLRDVVRLHPIDIHQHYQLEIAHDTLDAAIDAAIAGDSK